MNWMGKTMFAQQVVGLAKYHSEKKTVMVDATYSRAHQTATCMGVKREGCLIGKTKVGMNTKAQTICGSGGYSV
mgnify:CR=1 FL=1